MTVSNQNTKQAFAGDGVTVTFNATFTVTNNAVITGYVNEVLVANTTTVLEPDGSGAALTFPSAPADGMEVVVVRTYPLIQEQDYQIGGPVPPESLEQGLDETVMMIQQQQEVLDRTVQAPAGSPGTDPIELPIASEGAAIGWGANGELVNIPITGGSGDSGLAQVAVSSGDTIALGAIGGFDARTDSVVLYAPDSASGVTASANDRFGVLDLKRALTADHRLDIRFDGAHIVGLDGEPASEIDLFTLTVAGQLAEFRMGTDGFWHLDNLLNDGGGGGGGGGAGDVTQAGDNDFTGANDFTEAPSVASESMDTRYLKTALASAVATSNDYNDLDNLPTIPTPSNPILVGSNADGYYQYDPQTGACWLWGEVTGNSSYSVDVDLPLEMSDGNYACAAEFISVSNAATNTHIGCDVVDSGRLVVTRGGDNRGTFKWSVTGRLAGFTDIDLGGSTSGYLLRLGDVSTNLTERIQTLTTGEIDCNKGLACVKTVTADTTFSIVNMSTVGETVIKLYLTGGDAHTITWPAGILWSGGVEPTLTANSIVQLESPDGVTIYGAAAGGYDVIS